MTVYHCQACKTKPVIVASKDEAHCSGTYPFQCCCVCAASAGWKGWEDHACEQCRASTSSSTTEASSEPAQRRGPPPPVPQRTRRTASGSSDATPLDGTGDIAVHGDPGAEQNSTDLGFVNRRGIKGNAEEGAFTFQSLRKRTAFMKAKAAAMHAQTGVIAVGDDDEDSDAESAFGDGDADLPTEDGMLAVLIEGWLLKQSKTLKMWVKRYFVLDPVALYWAKSPHDVPDGFYPVRKCQFLSGGEAGCFEIITSGGRQRMQVAQRQRAKSTWRARTLVCPHTCTHFCATSMPSCTIIDC